MFLHNKVSLKLILNINIIKLKIKTNKLFKNGIIFF